MESRFPYLVDWALSAKCNLNCRHCRGFPAGQLPTLKARELVGEIAELKPGWVIVEGGEPFMRDDLFELLGLMRMKALDVHIASNGMLLDWWIISALKRLRIKLMISLDGATAETYETIRSGASFEKVMQSIERCAGEGILESVNFTLMKDNYREIPALFQMAKSLKVPKITLIGLKPCKEYHDVLLFPKEYREAIALTARAAQETGIDFFFDEPFFWAVVKDAGLAAAAPGGSAGILSPETKACIFGEYLFIETNGDVKPCSFSPMSVGNVREKPLGQLWQTVQESQLFEEVRSPQSRTGQCHECRYLAECKGCRSRTFTITGDWLATDPSCPLSMNAKEVSL